MSDNAGNRARRLALHAEGQRLHDEGRDDDAIEKYREAIAAEPAGAASSHYNIGLIHKYRMEWQASFDANLASYTLDPESESTRWNLAIAATALHDWPSARRAWADQGIVLDGEGPIASDFGQTPVRLNPDGNGEVVWARRIDPVRARIENVPLPDSGYCCGDIVLHDGAGVGYRQLGERKAPVFNVFCVFAPSPLSTFELLIDAQDAAAVAALIAQLAAAGLHGEDWSDSVQAICRQCSEGVPHDHVEAPVEALWQTSRRLGIASASSEAIELVLGKWQAGGGTVGTLTCALAADEFVEN